MADRQHHPGGIVLRRTGGIHIELIHATSGHGALVAVRDNRTLEIETKMTPRKYGRYKNYLRYYGKWLSIDKGVPYG